MRAASGLDWFTVAMHLLMECASCLDIPALQEVDDVRSMRVALVQVANRVTSKAQLRGFLEILKLNIPDPSSTPPPEPSCDASFDWFLRPTSAGKLTPPSSAPRVPDVLAEVPTPSCIISPQTCPPTPSTPTPFTLSPVHEQQLGHTSVVRLCILRPAFPPQRYIDAVHAIFHVSPPLTDDHLRRGYFHLDVPSNVMSSVFGQNSVMDMTHSDGFSFRLRSKDVEGRPYQLFAQLRRLQPASKRP
eukprot:EG_transcript_2000